MEKARRRLGRGLEALLGPTSVAEARASGSLTQLQLSSVRPNPYQPRHAFDEKALDELKNSLDQVGLLQPVIVRPTGNHSFELIAGERRCRAAEALGWEAIDGVIREVDDRTLLTLALVENLQRDALSPIDEARGYQRMIDEFRGIAGRGGRTRGTRSFDRGKCAAAATIAGRCSRPRPCREAHDGSCACPTASE